MLGMLLRIVLLFIVARLLYAGFRSVFRRSPARPRVDDAPFSSDPEEIEDAEWEEIDKGK